MPRIAAMTLLMAGAGLWLPDAVRAAPAKARPEAKEAAEAASAAPAAEVPASASAPAELKLPLVDPMEMVRERLKDKLRPRPAAVPPGGAVNAGEGEVDDPESLAMARLRERLAKRLGVETDTNKPNELRLTTRTASPAEVEATRRAAHSGSPRKGAAEDAGPGSGGGARSAAAATPAMPASAPAGPAKRTAAAASPTVAAAPVPAPQPGQPWAYDGPNGPAAWARLKPEFALCGNGKRQSPIDLRDGIQVNLEPLAFDYRPSSLRVVDDGRSLQAQVGAGNTVQLNGRRYELQTVQFHTPAEDRVQGKTYDMSAHLLHKDPQGHVLVVSVLLERGSPQSVLQTVLDNLPLEKGDDVNASQAVDWSKLMPLDPRYFIYMGSLSAPPCSEGVVRVVMKSPMSVSPEQFSIFSRLYPMNARPVQAATGRIVKESN
jgi:carbonic anhydrase